MERFTEKDHKGFYLVGDLIYGDDGDPEKFRGDAIDRLAHYEDLEEQGRLVVLPESTDKATVELLKSGKMTDEQMFRLSAIAESALAAASGVQEGEEV